MIFIKTFALLFFAHFIADVFAYSPKLSSLKRGRKKKGSKLLSNASHCLIHAMLTWIVLYPLDLQRRNFAALYIFVLHFVIDMARIRVESLIFKNKDFVIFTRKDILNLIFNRNRKDVSKFFSKHLYQWLLLNLIDQSTHIASIIILVYILNRLCLRIIILFILW